MFSTPASIRYLSIVILLTLPVVGLACGSSSSDDSDGPRSECTVLSTLEAPSSLDDDCYLVDRRHTLDQSAITIGPGTTFYFQDRAGLSITDQASLDIQGTADEPVTFRGDTDRFATWRGLHITASGPHSIDHLHLRGGGDDRWDLSRPLTQGGLVLSDPGVDLTLRNSHLSHNAGAGLSATPGASLSIETSRFHDNDHPLRLSPQHLHALTSDNEFQDNRHRAITLHIDADTSLQDPAQWPSLNIPLRLNDVLKVESTLEIAGPNTLLFARHAGLDIGDGGRLLVESQHDDEPVVFRGTTDDAGHWRGLRIHSSSPLAPSRLQGVEILHGASERWDPNWSNSQAALLIHQGGHLHLSDARIAHSDYHGISTRDATLEGCDNIEYDSNRRHDRHHYDGDSVCF